MEEMNFFFLFTLLFFYVKIILGKSEVYEEKNTCINFYVYLFIIIC